MGGVGGLFDRGQLGVLLALEHAGVVTSLQIPDQAGDWYSKGQ